MLVSGHMATANLLTLWCRSEDNLKTSIPADFCCFANLFFLFFFFFFWGGGGGGGGVVVSVSLFFHFCYGPSTISYCQKMSSYDYSALRETGPSLRSVPKTPRVSREAVVQGLLFFFLQRWTAVQVISSLWLVPQNQLPSLLPSSTAWLPDQHQAAMLADVSRHILGRTEGRGLGFLSACPHSHREVSEMPILFR